MEEEERSAAVVAPLGGECVKLQEVDQDNHQGGDEEADWGLALQREAPVRRKRNHLGWAL